MFAFQPPKDDGGMPLTFYTVEKQDYSLKGEWILQHVFFIQLSELHVYLAENEFWLN